MNLDMYIKPIHQVLYESIKMITRILIWDRGGTPFLDTWLRHVLSAIPVYILIAMNDPKWVIKLIDKIRRGFLWKGRM
jgi:hypothetical protein